MYNNKNNKVMKTTILGMLAVVFTLNIQAQNKNLQTEVKTTVTTIKDSDGEKRLVKSEVTKEVQKVGVEVEKERPDTKNIPMANNPVEVTSTTTVNHNVVTKELDGEKSTYYMLDGMKYQIKSEEGGSYTMYTDQNKPRGIMRKTSNNNYIFYNKNKFSVGYFDAEGNFILETYNNKSDKLTTEKYLIQK